MYSLGLTLYELLALRPAFDEADRNKLVKQVMHDEPARPRKLNPSVPRDLETVVLKAIARDPAHRYQTPAEMAEDLKRFVEDRPVRRAARQRGGDAVALVPPQPALPACLAASSEHFSHGLSSWCPRKLLRGGGLPEGRGPRSTRHERRPSDDALRKEKARTLG